MEAAGHECIGYVEIDKFARKSYEAIHDTEGEWTAHDITRVTDESIRGLKGVDVICGGFPCQAFSVAGKRGGFSDTRGTLFFEIARFANILRPRYLFLENVTGLLSHDNGNTFETILGALDEIGYDAEWDVLNSKNFGVPQNRERVFIIGHLRGQRTRKVFPIGTENTSVIEVIGRLEGVGHDQNSRVYGSGGVAPCLNTVSGGGQCPKVLVNATAKEITKINPSESACLLARNYKGLGNQQSQTMVMEPVAVLTPDRAEKRQNGRRFKEPGEPMFTLTSQDRHGIMMKESENNGDAKEKDTFEILSTLQKEVGEKEFAKWRFRIFNSLQQEEILRQGMYGESIWTEGKNGQSELVYSTQKSKDNQDSRQMREVLLKQKCGRSPQGRELAEQFAREFRSVMQELPYERTQIETIMQNLQQTTKGIKLLQQALYKIQKIWRSAIHEKPSFRIRKLTPRETFRLQGFPDWAFDRAAEVNSDSQLYKQAGNTVSIPPVYQIAKRL